MRCTHQQHPPRRAGQQQPTRRALQQHPTRRARQQHPTRHAGQQHQARARAHVCDCCGQPAIENVPCSSSLQTENFRIVSSDDPGWLFSARGVFARENGPSSGGTGAGQKRRRGNISRVRHSMNLHTPCSPLLLPSFAAALPSATHYRHSPPYG